jgi:hypothetical protein
MPAVDLGLQRVAEGEQLAVFRPSFVVVAAKPAQNASGEIPVLGVASLAMKSNRTAAIFNPWASTRFMMGFLDRNGR